MAVDKNSISGDLVFPPNSDKSREPVDIKPAPESDMKKVVAGNVTIKKKSPGRKFLRAFLQEDRKSIGEYLLYDFAVPAMQSMISDIGRSIGDAFSNAVDIALFGDVRAKPKSGGPYYSGSIYNYNAQYNYGKKTQARMASQMRQNAPQSRERFDIGEVILETKADADGIVEALRERIEAYGQASVLDLQMCLGITGEWTDASWGWENLDNVRVVRYRGAWRVDFPPLDHLD